MNISKQKDDSVIRVDLSGYETDAVSSAELRTELSAELDQQLLDFVIGHQIKWPWTAQVFDIRGAQTDFFVGIWGALQALKEGRATIKTKEQLPPIYHVEWQQNEKYVVVSFGETHPRSLL